MKPSAYNISHRRDGATYLFNGVSGGLLKLSPAQEQRLAAITAGDCSEADAPLLLQLLQGRMVLPDDADELALLRERYATSRRNHGRVAYTVVTSLGCNFGCPYCFEDKPPGRLEQSAADAIWAHARGELAAGADRVHVTWFGGEPLMGLRELTSLSARLRDLCAGSGAAYSADVITNGYLLTRPVCEALHEERVETIQVGLDGPPRIHDRMRSLLSGRETWSTIVENLKTAVEYFDVSVRVNVTTDTVAHAPELLQLLADEGLAGRVRVYLGHLVADTTNPAAPSATFDPARCLSHERFSAESLAFARLARRLGFAEAPSLPTPCGAPCTAVRDHEWVVGPRGELWKCWDSVGDFSQVLGNIKDVAAARVDNGWSRYDPFADPECTACIALPVCMGGCAHYGLDPAQRANRCGTFKHNHEQQIADLVDAHEAPVDLPFPALRS